MYKKKKKLLVGVQKIGVFSVVLLFFIFMGSVAYAQNESASAVLEATMELTEENRYQSVFYQEPKLCYPINENSINAQNTKALSLEEYVVKELSEFRTNINVSSYNISREEAGNLYFQILNNHPELFYVEKTVRFSYSGNRLLSYSVTYTDTVANIRIQKQEFEAEVEKAIAQVDTSLSQVEQALIVHDYLALKCEYDYEQLLLTGTVPEISHTAYGALVNEIAVCDGYSGAYEYIMEEKLGIPCDMVTSEAMNHAWNIICLDGEWYHIDLTWNDPAWDSVGRVCHDYFLLSDTAISDDEDGHTGWEILHTADSVIYDNAFWSDIRSAICYFNNEWYYSRENAKNYKSQLFKKSELLGTDEECIYTEEDYWNNWAGSYIYLDIAGENLYFNTPTEIKKIRADGTIESAYEPALSGKQLIFGFKIEDDILYYSLQETPNISAAQNLKEYVLPELSKPQEPEIIKPELTGITAENIMTVYDGTEKRIILDGILADDIIMYAGEDGIYKETQPEMINAGIYYVDYRVEREGYQSYTGSAVVEIKKATPEYDVPQGLTGKSGQTLGEIVLPTGFVWQSEKDTVFYEEGIYVYYVAYIPTDSMNYVNVTNIEVMVTVSCPGHEYSSEIIEEATETRVGKAKHTCEYCGDSYIEDIPMLEPGTSEGGSPGAPGIPTEPSIPGEGTAPSEPGTSEGSSPGAPGIPTDPLLPGEGEGSISDIPGIPSEPSIPEEEPTPDVPGIPTEPPTTGEGSNPGVPGIPTDPSMPGEGEGEGSIPDVPGIPIEPSIPGEGTTSGEPGTSTNPSIPGEGTTSGEPGTSTNPSTSGEGTTPNDTINSGEITNQEAIECTATISNLKTSKSTKNSLKFTWNKVDGIKYRLELHQGNKRLSTIYTNKNTYTFKKLKAATLYSLQITPYIEMNGTKIYAAATKTIKAATAPEKVKIARVKKSGSKAVKISWKKLSGVSGYEVYMKTGSGKYKKIKTTKAVSYKKSALKKGKKYTFKVRAYILLDGKKIYGSYSSVKVLKI